MKQLKSDEARRDWRDLLDEVQRDPAAAIGILRYDKPVAVVVSSEWFRQAKACLDGTASINDLRERAAGLGSVQADSEENRR